MLHQAQRLDADARTLKLAAMHRRAWILLLVIAACAGLYLVGNGRVALWDRDEPRYALASRWMLEQGDWIVPRIGWGNEPTLPRTAKPILIYWSQAAAMALFGVGSFAVRFPSAVAMTATLTLVGLVLWRFIGARRAMWAVLVLGTSAMVIVAAKMCVPDSLLLLWITIGQLCLCAIYHRHGSTRALAAPGDSRSNTRWIAGIMWIAIALGGLTKGPVVLGVHLTTMLVLLLMDVGGRWRQWQAWRNALGWWRRTHPLMGMAILAIICGPWLWMLHQREPSFLPRAIGHDVIARSTRALEGHKGPPGFYLLTIFGTYFPWSLLLPLTIGLALRHRRLRPVRFALAAVIGPWVMMELVATKLVHYVLPIFPPLAFLTSDALVRCFRGQYPDLRNRLAVMGTGAWGWIAMALGAAPWVGWYYFYDFPVAAAAAVTVLTIAWATAAYQLMRRRRPQWAMGAIGGGMIVVMLAIWGWFIPAAGFLKVGQRAGRALAEHGATQPGQVAMLHGYREQSVAFYQGGTIREVEHGDHLLTNPPERWPRWLVIEWADWQRLPESHRAHLRKISAFDGLNIAKGELVHVIVAERKLADGSATAAD